ncbi:hypothetical protein [methane-oxidizing endosymbiont of Gigantopelta aegis]|uniref:hypothetical protein n=1 Tax=methane-oxidizing endosymbiont of Gigantopelta aegis TaxID=2794938 RepID=UPI0018DC277A|nr:hypothetical protein [methane-oxidizing endosymbiont of Gigantopelta aegis]
MELWRDGNRVLYVYPDQGLAEQWERSGHGSLHLTTWFDKDKQGISICLKTLENVRVQNTGLKSGRL